MNLHRGPARIAVTAGVVLAVVSFVAGPIAYKAFGRPYRYMVPGPGERLTLVFGKAEAAPHAVFTQTGTDLSRPETAPHLLAPLPPTARSGLSSGEWVWVGIMATLAGLVVFLVAVGSASRTVGRVYDVFRGQRSPDQGVSPDYDRCVEDCFTENNTESLASVQGLCYEELVGLEVEECDFYDGTGLGKTEGIPEVQPCRLAAVTA